MLDITRFRLIMGPVLLVILGMLLLTGCKSNRLQMERDALWVQNQELQDELSRARSALDMAESDRASLVAENDQLRAEMSRRGEGVGARANSGFMDIAGVETFTDAGGIHVRVPGDVLFSPGKVTLRSEAKETLDQIIGVIKREYGGQVIRVEGYTDTDPIRKSKWKDNLELSLQRAAAVHRYLQSKGISADQMYAAGFGETRPRETKAKSRRVEIVVVNE